MKLGSGGRAVFSREDDVESFAVTAYALNGFSVGIKVRNIVGYMLFMCVHVRT